MPRARKICPKPDCGELQPCPKHPKMVWAGAHRGLVARGPAARRERTAVLQRDNWTCHVCGQPGADEVDHVIPVTEGGSDTMSNKAAIHSRPCHAEKTQREAQRGRARVG